MNRLPLDDAWPELAAALNRHRNLVVVAEPGAGKTTRLPPKLLIEGLAPTGSKVLVLEPRRLAARAAAARIADEQGWKLGQEVGYRVRFENRVTPATRLEFLTEGLLTRRLQSDPELKDVSIVVLDEFHERSLHTDLAIGLLSELQQLARPDLRLIVMSATLDAEAVARYLGDAPVVRVPGRTYPVTTHHADHPLLMETGPRFLDAVATVALDICEGRRLREGDVLVFLPGTREIRGVGERVALRASRAGFDCVELHGSLTLEDQDRAIARAPLGRSKIILATNIAESSLTIDGVGTVIDSGLARVVKWDAAGFARLQIARISLASAIQRGGRAGRQGPGHDYRLWSKLDESSMPAFETAEILRADLSDSLLTLLGQGVGDPSKFSWFEPPPTPAIRSGIETLNELGFREPTTGRITDVGREALKLPLPVRPARLVIEAKRIGREALGAKLAALLAEKDILLRSAQTRDAQVESDVLIRLHALGDGARGGVDRVARQNVLRASEQIAETARRLDARKLGPPNALVASPTLDDDEAALRLLMLGFPDRLARRRRPGAPAARMIGGRGVQLAPFSSVERAEFFVCLDAMEPPPSASAAVKSDPVISLASRIEREWIETAFAEFIHERTRLIFDDESGAVLSETARSMRDLPLGAPKIAGAASDDAHETLVTACLERWDSVFAAHSELSDVFARLGFLQRVLEPESRMGFLNEICFGQSKLASVLAKPLSDALIRHLPEDLAHALRTDAPERIRVPSGSEIRVQYPPDRAPFIEVRIQEVFGWVESPRIGRGAIQLHLLGPNYRPVQVTSDLASFWRNGYAEVRKELRARYPKHSWPDDPLTAKPEAKGRPRRS